MTDSHLIAELVRRAKVSPAAAAAVVDALAELAVEGRLGPGSRPARKTDAPPRSASEPFVPTTADVDALIDTARRHPDGIDFLLGGHLGSVAATFKAHAFTVEAARARIWSAH
jgi:hypothetical protein